MEKTRVLHIIGSLDTGGAETMLLKLVSASRSDTFEHSVVSLKPVGTLGDRFAALDVTVHSANLRSMTSLPAALWQIRSFARAVRPQLIQGWMYHGNIVALLASDLFLERPPVLWSIRHSIYDLRDEKKGTARIIRLGARLSGRAMRIVYNADVSARQHEAIGYSPLGRIVVPNGFDCDRFKPSAEARASTRRHLGVDDATPLIGMVARYHPMKDHETLVAAARIVAKTRSDVRFVLAGTGVDDGNAELTRLLDGVRDRFHLLGERDDVAHIAAALDIGTLSSYSEAFPNVIGEAMACGVPVVATDVGESAAIIGDTGRVTPARDAAALAGAWIDLLDRGADARAALGHSARERIVKNYPIAKIAGRYTEIYAELA